MANKQTTVKQKQTKYRALQYLTLGGEYISIATPFVTLGIINKDTWFHSDNGFKTGIGFVLACVLFFIIVSSITFESEKLNNRKGKYIKVLIGTILSAIIFVLLSDIMSEIANILFVASFGIATALGLDITSESFKTQADTYKNAIARAKEKHIQDKAEQELSVF